MQELLNLSKQPRRNFAKHFLASVHSEIRCPKIIKDIIFENKDLLKSKFKELNFAECHDVVSNQMSFHSDNNQQFRLNQQITPLGLKFICQSPRLEIQIANGSIIFSDFAYSGLEEFLSKFKVFTKIIQAIFNIADKELIDKASIRKINSITIEPVNSLLDVLNSAFKPSLFSMARSGLFNFEAFKVSEEKSVLEYKENLCIIQSKLYKKDKHIIEAVLDFDLVSLVDSNFEEAFSSIIPSLNQTHFDLFMSFITDELVMLMERG